MYHYCAKLFESAGAPRWAQRTGIEWMKGEPPMNTPGKASLPVIKRLPKYYRFLRTLKNDGITSISSRELAAQMGTTASQVRQDFNCIGDVNGRQGIGFNLLRRNHLGGLRYLGGLSRSSLLEVLLVAQ